VEENWAAIGLSDFDGCVYRRVLREPAETPQALAGALGCSAARVRRAVHRLVAARLLRPAPGTALGARPIDPRAGLGVLVRDRRAALDGIATAADQLGREYTAGQLRAEPTRLLETVEGREPTVARIEDVMRAAVREVVGTDTPPYVADGSEEVSEAEQTVLARGVRFRALYAAEVLDHPRLVARIAEMVALGEEARVLPDIPVKLLVVDGSTAVMPLAGETRTPRASGGPPTAERARTVIVSDSALTGAVQALFDLMWAQATPLRLGGESGLVAAAGDDDTAGLVNLLAAGMKDDAIARYLGISARTLRRRIGVLHDALGATGRFQAGARAAQRGWIPDAS
jgi:hypothetical protein